MNGFIGRKDNQGFQNPVRVTIVHEDDTTFSTTLKWHECNRIYHCKAKNTAHRETTESIAVSSSSLVCHIRGCPGFPPKTTIRLLSIYERRNKPKAPNLPDVE
jgi:hypothetical protein